MPYGITQYYLPPGRADNFRLYSKKTGTRFSDPEGMQNDRVDLDDWLHREMVYPPEDGHPSK